MKTKAICHRDIRQLVRALRNNVGETIHAARKERGVTLNELAKKTYLPPDAIDRIELGKGELDFIHVARLSVALDIDMYQLFC